MIDSSELNAAIAEHIKAAVEEQVANIFQNDEQLQATIRSQAVSLLVRNFNLDNSAKDSLARDAATQLAELLAGGETDLLANAGINEKVAANIDAATDKHVASMISSDPELQGNIKKQAIKELVRQISIGNNVEAIIANKIAEQFAEQFDGVGIYSEATKRELTVMDDNVVVEGTLSATNISTVNRIAADEVVISGRLSAMGPVNPNDPGWSQLRTQIVADVENNTQLKSNIVALVKAQANDINFNELTVNGKTAIKDGELCPSIITSTLTKVGTLAGLKVIGTSTVDAIHSESKRVGINTKTPNSALAVWDDEVEVLVGKLKENHAFIGTNRTQALSLGVSRGDDIVIGTDGVTTIKKLKVGERSISHGDRVPNYAGTAGDLVFNTKLDINNPVFAWYCLHGFKWVPLKAA